MAKKILSMVLILCLSISILGTVPAFANVGENDSTTEEETITYTPEEYFNFSLSTSNGEYYGTINGYTGTDTEVYIPKTINGIEVKRIWGAAFNGRSDITKVVVPDTVIFIGASTFRNCSSLSSVSLPDSVTEIGSYAFQGCYSLESITLPSGITKIDDYTFDNCCNLKTINLGSNIVSIGDYAFRNCSNIKEITLPDTVESIGFQAFYYCSSLKTIEIPEGVTSIGRYTFSNCSQLASISLPSTLTAIEGYAFEYTGLKTINISDSVETIGSYAFRGSSLESVKLPSSLEVISESVFRSTNIKYVTIPSGVTTIENYAFYYADIEYVIIPETLTSIGDYVFYGTSLADIYYSGTADKWTEVAMGSGNDAIYNANQYYNYTKVTGLSLTETEVEIDVGDTKALTPVYAPETASIKKCSWASSNTDVAIVNENGAVTAVSQGTAIITATSVEGGYTANCTVTTKNVAVTGMEFEEDSLSLVIGKDAVIETIFSPENATIRTIVWDSSDEDVAKIENGIVTGVGKGTATITGTTVEGEFTDTLTVNVVDNIASGTLDNGFTWVIHYTGELEITGTGDMPDFSVDEDKNSSSATGADEDWDKDLAPWYQYREDIESVKVNEGITNISNYAFAYCYKLNSASIAQTVTSVGKSAFESCNLSEIYLPNNIETIGNYAFAHNNSLENVALPANLISIGDEAFYYCRNLDSIEIPDKVTSIGKCAFMECSLSYIFIPSSVTSIGGGAFTGNLNLNTIGYDPENTNFVFENGVLYNKDYTTLIMYLCGSTEYFEVPSTVTKIEDYAFYCNWQYTNGLYQIVLPESVKTIGDYAFHNNSANINLPSGLTSLGECAFYNCKGLTSVTIPSGITEIPDLAFSNCGYLYELNLHDNVTKIGQNSFSNCSQLYEVTMPANLETIDEYAFSWCGQLRDIEFNNKLKTIGRNAFYGCTFMSYADIPASVTKIGASAFGEISTFMGVFVDEANTAYTDIDGVLFTKDMKELIAYPRGMADNYTYIVPDGVTKIADEAFAYAQIQEIILPDSITEIGDYAFQYSRVEDVYNMPNTITSIGRGAFRYTNIHSIALPNNLAEIPDMMFYGCQSLNAVTIGTGTTKIDTNAFGYTTLNELYINGAITEIKDYAFYDCQNLRYISFAGTTAQWDAITIGQNNEAFINADYDCDCKNIKGISLDKTKLTMKVGETYKLTATVVTDSTDDIYVNWWYSGPDIAWIDEEGNITAENGGRVIITAHTDGGYSAVCIVDIEDGGRCGENVNWKLKGDGTLIISGTGPMYDYDYTTAAGEDMMPWLDYQFDVSKVVVESGVTSIGNYAFANLWNCKNIEISNTVTSIGDYAFRDGWYKNITIPASVTTISDYAFTHCNELRNIIVDSNNTAYTSVDGILYNKAMTKLIKHPCMKNDDDRLFEIPSTVKEIAPYAMQYTDIMAVIIPSGATTIGDYAFAQHHSLEYIIIPDSITSIGKDAFSGCPIRIVVYEGTADDAMTLFDYETTDGNVNPLLSAVNRIYESNDKVHIRDVSVFDNGFGTAGIFVEFSTVLELCNVLVGVYDTEGRLIETKLWDIDDLYYDMFDFTSEYGYYDIAEVRVFPIKNVTSLAPVGNSMNWKNEDLQENDNPATGGGSGGTANEEDLPSTGGSGGVAIGGTVAAETVTTEE